MVDTILRRAEVERATGLRTSSLYERIKAGTFPRPVKINSRSVGWLSSEVEAWQRVLREERDAVTVRQAARQAAEPADAA
jgi:prophage regulatory protein